MCLAIAAILGACAGSPAAPTPPVVGPAVTTPEQAMAAIVATEPRFANVQQKDLDQIGQSAWWEARPASGVGAFVVAISVGWGDCQAGCIDSHTWTYAVTPDGGVRLLSEDGPPVPPEVLPAAAQTGVTGRVTAGPVCPVETNPPDPACAPRPVDGARIVVVDAGEQVIAEARTGPDGSFVIGVPAGDYTLLGDPVVGLMGVPDATPVTVSDGALTSVDLAYDTGIR